MRLFDDTKVYIICPGSFHTGGAELLHQLCSVLLKYNIDAYMYYFSGNMNNPVDSFYLKYHLPYTNTIEDTPHNVVVLYEGVPNLYFNFKSIQKVFWWLSADNYVKTVINFLLPYANSPMITKMPRFLYFDNIERDTEHWVQSEYARQFITFNGVSEKNIYMVEDYVNQVFLERADKIDLSKKIDIVVFNPKKGFEFTKRLIEHAPNIKWIPIQNMTPEQIQELLARAKVYIDFGNHPGKDRIPREAAISGCVVITGKRGSAANNIDINIPAEFKFDESVNLQIIISKIQEVFNNFELNYNKQSDYRKRILDDKPRFEKQVAKAFNINTSTVKDAYAVPQGMTDKGYAIVQLIHQTNLNGEIKFIIDDRFDHNRNFPMHPYIQSHNHDNYFVNPNGGGYRVNPIIISNDDAKFLYLEGRITKFILLNPIDEEINSVTEKFLSKPEDILIIEV